MATDYEELLRQAQPSWFTDGRGIRGADIPTAKGGAPVLPLGTTTDALPQVPTITKNETIDLSPAIPAATVQQVFTAAPAPTPAATNFFQLVSIPADAAIKVIASTIAGIVPTSPTPDVDGNYPFAFTADNNIYAKVVIDVTDGSITSAELVSLAPAAAVNTDTDWFYIIGSMTGTETVTNYVYGPIYVQVCGGYSSMWIVNFTVTATLF